MLVLDAAPEPPERAICQSEVTRKGATRRDRFRFRSLLLLLAYLLITIATDATAAAARVGVVTMQPGELAFERFGHNALLIDPGDGSEPISYNFGYFNFDEPRFFYRLIRGEMRYRLLALPLETDLEAYRLGGRGVSVQWLNLNEGEIAKLAAKLAMNALPENAFYDYRYFTDNCSTRVRDALDAVVGGALRRQLSASSLGNTYRSEALRLALPEPWMAAIFHIGLAAAADRPLSRWDEAFVPMRLADSLRTVERADGQPLVAAETVLLPHRLPSPPAELPQWRLESMFIGLGLALAVLWIGRRWPRAVAVVALGFWLVAGVLGCVLVFLWFGTEHNFAHANENLLLLSPLALLLLPGAVDAARGKLPRDWFEKLLLLVLVMAALGAFLKLLPFMRQENVDLVLLLVPLHWALARHFRNLAEKSGADG